jgi:reversibly glycosylated polypeptide/UDP-arabinopyranose mutase
MSIAVVVPTCRTEQIDRFMDAWRAQFVAHDATVLIVRDDTETGDIHLWRRGSTALVGNESSVLGAYKGIVARKSPACRCLGFAYIAKHLPEVTHIVTLDDDVEPSGDTIGDHIEALDSRVPVSWLSSVTEGPYMRGFPYAVRAESPVFVSHGVWENIPDLDAPTQLVLGDKPRVTFYRGPVPRGVFFPVCGMNLAFRREALPMMLWCPAKWLKGAERFDDIWMGVNLVKELPAAGGALVSGYASCVHTRLSNTFKNLEQEAVGIGVNETLWAGGQSGLPAEVTEFLKRYDAARVRWREMICQTL